MIPNAKASTTVQIPASADAYISSQFHSNNYGTATLLYVQTEGSRGSSTYRRRSLFNFDLSTIPSGVVILEATLKLYFYWAPHIDRDYSVHRITSTWAESTVKWDNAPTFSSTPTSTIATGTTDEVWLSWDVTADVSYGYSNPSSWYGFLVKDNAEYYSTFLDWNIYSLIASKEHTTTDWHPYLEVTYASPFTTNVGVTVKLQNYDIKADKVRQESIVAQASGVSVTWTGYSTHDPAYYELSAISSVLYKKAYKAADAYEDNSAIWNVPISTGQSSGTLIKSLNGPWRVLVEVAMEDGVNPWPGTIWLKVKLVPPA